MRHANISHRFSKQFGLGLILGLIVGLTVTAAPIQRASAVTLAPFKDKLYEVKSFDGRLRKCDAPINERTLKLPTFGGRHIIYDFNEQRDVNGRDVPMPNGKWQNVAQPKYITRLDDRDQRSFDLRVTTARGTRILPNNEVGNPNGAKFAIIFIHGAAGIYANRDLGMKDETFSGNFNRLKNMVVQNGGVYYTPTIEDFERAGPDDVAALITHIATKSPDAPIVLSCASSGGSVCAGVAKNDEAAKNLSGIVIMGASWGHDFLGSAAHRRRVPVVFAQGTCDRGNPYDRLFSLFAVILKRDDTYPTRFLGFADGVHGTPIRMIDWRETLNWLFSIKN